VVISNALDRPAPDSAIRLQADLAARVDFEQSFLHEVLEWVGYVGKPLFNSFVNILMYEGVRHPISAESSTRMATSDGPIFVPGQQGDIPMDFAPTEPMMHGKTAVDGLELGYLAEKNLYLDVVRSVEDDSVDFGFRCDAELMDEGMVRAFAGQIAGEVVKIVESFEKRMR